MTTHIVVGRHTKVKWELSNDTDWLIDWLGFNVSTNTVWVIWETQPTVSKYWRKKCYKSKENPEKQTSQNTAPQ